MTNIWDPLDGAHRANKRVLRIVTIVFWTLFVIGFFIFNHFWQ